MQFVAFEPKFAKIRGRARKIPLHLSKRHCMMRASNRSLTISRLAAAGVALWLGGAGAAWAGDGGGADLASLNNVLGGVPFGTGGLCASLGVPFCPQTPTVTQAVLQIAAWTIVPTEMIRATNSIPISDAVNAGNPSIPPVGPTPPPITTALPVSGTVLSNLLANLTPLAFTSAAQTNTGAAAAVPLYNTNADTFLYAVGSLHPSDPQSVQPDTVYFLYEDLSRNTQTVTNGQIFAKFSFPLTVLNNDGSESPPMITTLRVIAACTGGPSCLQAQVIGGFGASTSNPVPATQLGIGFGLVFAPSQLSTRAHAIFQWSFPSLITGACSVSLTCSPGTPDTDPLYFFNPISNIGFSFFVTDNLGFQAQSCPGSKCILGNNGMSVGIAPSAGPFGPPPASGVSSPFALCASLPDNSNGPGAHLYAAVGAYYAMATTGEMLLSAPVPAAFTDGNTPPSCQL
jgi:hypothetical protein